MKRTNWSLGLLLAVLPLGACMAPVGVSGRTIPTNAAKICAGHCRTIGMTLSAVAIMAENVGCVCQAASDKDEEAAGELSTPAAGMATIALQAEAAADQQRRAAAGSHH
jgi:hypothetical protein